LIVFSTNSPQMSVACIGVIVADVLVQNVDRSVFDRDITRVPLIKLSTGGDAFNQSITLATLGYPVHLLGKIGTDSIATFLLAEGANRGVDVSLIATDPLHQTSISIVLIGPSGDRNFIGCADGTNSHLGAADFDISIFPKCRVVSLGSLYGSLSLTGSAIESVMAAAKAAGCVTVADMMHADRGSLDDAARALRFVDYFIPNEEEGAALTGSKDPAAIASVLLGIGVKCVVIKLGPRGCFLKTSETEEYIPAVPAVPVDTTGAGDAFVSGFISGIIDGCTPSESARRGCVAGSLAVRSVGATGWISSISERLDLHSRQQLFLPVSFRST
jgi:sugar/nucleoside kinase (ribokinase family)